MAFHYRLTKEDSTEGLIIEYSDMYPSYIAQVLHSETKRIRPEATDISVSTPMWEDNHRMIRVYYKTKYVNYTLADNYVIDAILELGGKRFILQEDRYSGEWSNVTN